MVEAATLAREEISSVVIKNIYRNPAPFKMRRNKCAVPWHRKENYVCNRINEKIMKLCGVYVAT